MKKIVAIGGGENGRFLEDGSQTMYETEIMDEEIIKLTNKKNPNYLFLAHAMCFSDKIQDSYYETMKKIYGDKYGCSCKCLVLDAAGFLCTLDRLSYPPAHFERRHSNR